MKLLNPNIPISNYISKILSEKNKEIKENILLGSIVFPTNILYSQNKNILETPSHEAFINNLYRQKLLSEVREEKSYLEKKVSMVDNQLLSIKKNNVNLTPINKLNFSERNININTNRKNNNFLNININSDRNNSEKIKKNKKSASSEKKSNKNNLLPTLIKDKKREKKLNNIVIKPIQIKSYKSNSKINNHEKEERLEKDAKAFIQRLNRNKKNVLDMINKKRIKFNMKLKNEIDKIEREKKLKMDEYNNKFYNYNYDNNNNMDNNYNIGNFSNMNIIENNNKYSPDSSLIKKGRKNKRYYHYSPYNSNNPKMLKNLKKDLLNFNSELYYNNNVPDIIHYQVLLHPLYLNNNNMINRIPLFPPLNADFNENMKNEELIEENNNREMMGNISNINNFSNGNDESNMDNNDSSFNKKHLYYFNEPKYEIELTSGDN